MDQAVLSRYRTTAEASTRSSRSSREISTGTPQRPAASVRSSHASTRRLEMAEATLEGREPGPAESERALFERKCRYAEAYLELVGDILDADWRPTGEPAPDEPGQDDEEATWRR